MKSAMISAFFGLSLCGAVWGATHSLLDGATAFCAVIFIHDQVSRVVEAIEKAKK